jgi:hypothetical protein
LGVEYGCWNRLHSEVELHEWEVRVIGLEVRRMPTTAGDEAIDHCDRRPEPG